MKNCEGLNMEGIKMHGCFDMSKMKTSLLDTKLNPRHSKKIEYPGSSLVCLE